MKFRRIAATVAMTTAAVLVLAGCTSGSSNNSETSEIQQGTSVTAAQNEPTVALNSYTTGGYTTYNSNIQYFTQATFNYFTSDQKLVKNTKLGTYEKTSDNPLTVKFKINKGATWSDGVQITASDLLLFWASNLTKYNDAKGVNFTGFSQGTPLDTVTKAPTVSDDGLGVTFVFDKPWADWEISGINPAVPSHVLWQEAFPDQKVSNSAAAQKVQDAILSGDTATLKPLAAAYSTKWAIDSMPSDKKLLVSSGPYVVSAFVKNQYITLKVRKGYKNGPAPKIEKFTMRFIADPTAQVQALANGEVSLIYGQALPDTVKAVQALKSGVTSETTPAASYEHIDLTYDYGPFSASSYGGDAAKALKVRQAFMKVIPRQEMLDKLIKPLSPSTTLDDSFMFLPGGQGYDESSKSSDYTKYQTVDVAGAKELLKEAGVKTPLTVRFTYPTSNPRRVSEFQLIQASAKQAGFNVVDTGRPGETYFDDMANNKFKYDASVFAYALPSISVGGSQPNIQTGNPSNYSAYSDKEVDALYVKALQASDYAGAVPDLVEIDKKIIADAAIISLYQLPDVSAWNSKLKGVKYSPLTPNIFWNYWEWSLK